MSLATMPCGHVVDGEGVGAVLGAALLGDAGVEDDLEEDVTELLPQFVAVALLDRLDELVRLLDAVLRQALVGLLGRPGALGADAVHDLDEVEEASARKVVGGGEQLQLGHRDAAGAREAGEAVREGGLALTGRDHDHRPALGAGGDQLLGGRRRLVDRCPRLTQIGQLRMRAVRAQHAVGGVQCLPGGPGQQPGCDTVTGGEQDDTAGGEGGVLAEAWGRGGFRADCVHHSKLTHAAGQAIRLSTGEGWRCDRMNIHRVNVRGVPFRLSSALRPGPSPSGPLTVRGPHVMRGAPSSRGRTSCLPRHQPRAVAPHAVCGISGAVTSRTQGSSRRRGCSSPRPRCRSAG